ncbi:MAG: D-aminoacylase [candidate division NC10 bacterium]|nr:D-aminoacylase [candidate division NC10 bacterium]MDE2320489.1 D-aminoacylase [candidate division NC10 bacterium]
MATYDLVIRGADLIDGTGAPARRADLAVAGDRIAEIGQIAPSLGYRVIEATGLTLAPGFVDIHSHSDYHLLLQPTADSAVRQGVTLEIGGNCGYAAAPIWGPWLEERATMYRDLYSLDHAWQGVAEYFTRLEAAGISENFGLLIGHNTLRGSAMGGANREPSTEELEAMIDGARRGMAEGALGVSTGLVYAPACFSRPQELTAIAAAVREAGGVLTCHMRNEGDGLLEAIEEIVGIAEHAHISLQISHLKTSGERNWPKLVEAFRLIENAQARGLDVSCDRYPYTASNTGLQAVLPDWALEGGQRGRVERLRNPAARARIAQELTMRYPADYWSRLMISEVTQEAHRRYEGLRVSEAAKLAEMESVDFVLELLPAERMQVDAIFFTMSEDNLKAILQKPYAMIGSDSGCRSHQGPLSHGRPHPRTFGTFPRVLSHFVRERRILDLPTAIRKMTLDPCRKLGLPDRGRLQPGCVADLVLFDPVTISDQATYEAPIQYPAGIHHVFVNGIPVVEAGEHTGARPGRIVRRSCSGPRRRG